MDGTLADILSWLEPHALLLALALPPVIRCVGHLVPEEIFMVAMGVLAARSESWAGAAVLLGAVFASHLVTDHALYLGGRWLHPRLGRFPRLSRRLDTVTSRLASSPSALVGLIPARVLPLGRGAWLTACGVVRVSWPRFLLADMAALTVHQVAWSGLGWWLAGDLRRLESTTHAGKAIGIGAILILAATVVAWFAWQRRFQWQPATARAARRLSRSLRQLGHPGR